MNSIEDRVHAAMSAVADLAAREIRTAPPLRLPPEPRARARRRAPRRWIRWAAPLTAAAAVAALAVALAVIRDIPNGGVVTPSASSSSPAPLPDVGGVPPYYAELVAVNGDLTTSPDEIVIGQTRTGKRVATVLPPGNATFAGITGAAGNRTFIVDTQPGYLANEGQNWQPRTWYLLRLFPGTAHVARLTRLPVPGTPKDTGVIAISLSPDGSMFAVATHTDPNLAMHPDTPVQLTVYSVATGKVLHSWSAPASTTTQFFGGTGGVGGVPDASHALAWTGPQDAPTGLAFGYAQVKPGKTVNGSQVSRPTFYGAQLRYLPLSAPSGTSLLSDSTSVPLDLVSNPLPAPTSLSCTFHAFFTLLLTGPTGKAGEQSLICAAVGSTRAPGHLNSRLCAAGPAWEQIGLMKYRLRNGKPSGTLVKYASACTGPLFMIEPFWTNAAGTVQLGLLGLRSGGTGANPRFGVFENGTFTPLPLPLGERVPENPAYIAW